MHTRYHAAIACLTAAGWLGAVGLAVAAEPDDAGKAPPTIDATIGTPLAVDALERMRGGEDSIDNDINVHGEVTGNSADRVVTGSNVIDGGSFGNAAGINTVIQNTGNNVLIQNAMIVNVKFADPRP